MGFPWFCATGWIGLNRILVKAVYVDRTIEYKQHKNPPDYSHFHTNRYPIYICDISVRPESKILHAHAGFSALCLSRVSTIPQAQ